jgi:hypothetical protein
MKNLNMQCWGYLLIWKNRPNTFTRAVKTAYDANKISPKNTIAFKTISIVFSKFTQLDEFEIDTG